MSDKHTVDGLMELARVYAHAYYNHHTGSPDGMLEKSKAILRERLTSALEAAQRLATQSAEDAQPKQLRALTMEEITSACGNHERNMHVIWAVQAKFCEVNGLPQVIARESSQRLAAQPGEPVAWRWRCLLKPDYTKYGSWQLTKDPERARAHPGGYGDWPGFQCEPLYASPLPQQEGADDDARWTIDRAADFLEWYAGFIRRVKPDKIEEHPYLPELDYVAWQLRHWFDDIPATSPQQGEKEASGVEGKS